MGCVNIITQVLLSGNKRKKLLKEKQRNMKIYVDNIIPYKRFNKKKNKITVLALLLNVESI